ncbi:flavodoxin family protein [Anaerovorax odorimutans]|uniref:Flavodoxin family protein n=1 Tax=Anaerovorax odorimutans TaxID=109327 RepID=A0ABT1RSS5_9FIRM|nr:flavodoxin family protein [Anaerovorax odorimutans]MCQ4638222.1 flavodoxin family protein [Anaerovorax odorimutans]
MKYCILMGSPRKNGNTAALLKPFTEELAACGHEYDLIHLYDKEIKPCTACRTCQADWSAFACRFSDDAAELAEKLLACDVIVLATPVYSWYCTPPMKALLDRMVYGLNKYYGEKKGPSLWKGKPAALITTCGYPPEKGADLLEEGIRRYCKHSQLRYLGMLAERHMGYQTVFMDEEKERHAREFARKLCGKEESRA